MVGLWLSLWGVNEVLAVIPVDIPFWMQFTVDGRVLAFTLAATEEQLNQRFTVQPGGKLVVDVNSGSIDVATHETGEVVVDVWRKVTRRTKAEEEKFLQDHPVTLSQDGNTVTIRCRRQEASGWSWRGRSRIEAKYTITVPAQFNAQPKTSGGGIAVSDLAGEVKANISGGGIDVNGGSGFLDGHTSGGSMTVRAFKRNAHVGTSGGGLMIENMIGQVESSTSGGSVSAVLPSPLPGDVKLSTSAGGVTVVVPADAAFDLDASIAAPGSVAHRPGCGLGIARRPGELVAGAAGGESGSEGSAQMGVSGHCVREAMNH